MSMVMLSDVILRQGENAMHKRVKYYVAMDEKREETYTFIPYWFSSFIYLGSEAK